MRNIGILLAFLIALASRTALGDEKPLDYTDNDFHFGFQFPQSWKIQPNPPSSDSSQTRVLIQSPTKTMYVTALVGNIGKSVSKERYDANPKKDELLQGMIQLTIDQVYEKLAHQVGADQFKVAETKPIDYGVGFGFYISTLETFHGSPMVIFGQHVVPFDKPYVISFIEIMPFDAKATEDNETATNILNSFHLIGEKPQP